MPNCELPARAWRMSNASGGTNCVEVAFVEQGVLLRDSKNPRGPVLQFSPAEWAAFLSGVRDGEFDPADACGPGHGATASDRVP